RRGIILPWPNAGVEDGQLLEVCENTERQLCRPSVPPQLQRRDWVFSHVHRRLLGFQEKLPSSADSEAIVRGLRRSTNAHRVLVNDFLVGLRIALSVRDIPSQKFEKRIKKLLPQLALLVAISLAP